MICIYLQDLSRPCRELAERLGVPPVKWTNLQEYIKNTDNKVVGAKLVKTNNDRDGHALTYSPLRPSETFHYPCTMIDNYILQ